MSYVPKDTIYLCLAHMSDNGLEQKFIKEAFDTNWVVPLGPNVNGFERELETFLSGRRRALRHGATDVRETSNKPFKPYFEETLEGEAVANAPFSVVALSAGTAAAHLALLACGVGRGDEVIVQSFTFCASSNPITYLGAKPVFVDSEPTTWNMDPDLLEVAIKDRIAQTGKAPKAIIPVALYGMPYDAERIVAIANRYGIPVIEDAAEGFGSRFDGRTLGTFGRFGVLSFNGNKMITTSGGGALVCRNAEDKNTVMWYATQARDAYPYYQHTAIGYNYRMSNICAGIGRGQLTVAEAHIAHHKHVQALYEELLGDCPGLKVHTQPEDNRYDSNFWLVTATLAPDVKVIGQEDAYKDVVTSAVGGAAGVIKAVESATTDCQPNDNVEAMRVFLALKRIESRPVWKPMHKQPVYCQGEPRRESLHSDYGNVERVEYDNSIVYTNGVSESIFKKGFCLPAGPYVSDADVRYIVDSIKQALFLNKLIEVVDEEVRSEPVATSETTVSQPTPMVIDDEVIGNLLRKASESDRQRTNFDLRDSIAENSQRMLNAMLPGTSVPIHRHRNSSELMFVVSGRLIVSLYNDDGTKSEEFVLCPAEGNCGFQIPKGRWHTVSVEEPTVILEMKDGAYQALSSDDIMSR